MVNQGLRPAAVAWAFTATHSNNWHPLTSLSHMLDFDLFGVRPGPMHIENLCWHVANTVLLFLLWKRMTGSRWRSAFIAALFALHPLHVESVAWISERKDVLSTFFVLLSLLAYVAYVNRKSEIRNPKFEAGSKLPERDLNAESAKNAEERKAISRRLEVRKPT